MKLKHIILFILLVLYFLFVLIPIHVSAQNQVISGICLDNRNRPIRDVGIYTIDSTILTVTNNDGLFSLKYSKPGDTIYASHVTFENVVYIIDSLDVNKRIVLKMKPTSLQLPEVEIVDNAPHVAYNNKVVSVMDFEINEKGIYLLARRRRSNSLLHLNFNCDTITELKISPDYYNIYKDVYGEMQLVSDEDVWQIGHKTIRDYVFEMELMYRTPTDRFVSLFKNIVCATDSLLIGGRYVFFGQEIYYYYFNIGGDQQAHELHHCVNEENRDLMINLLNQRFGTFYRSAGFLDPKPTYDPVFAYDNRIYLFSFDEDKLFVYNNLGEVVGEYPLTFHKYKHWRGDIRVIKKWDKKVILDWATGDFYTTFTDGGVTTIKKVDIEHGTAQNVAVLGGFPFIENLRIYNGKAYFLFKNDNTRNNRLFEVKIE